MILQISMNDDEYKFISEYAAKENLSVEKFMIESTLEQIEDKEDLKLYEKAETEFKADPMTYSHEEVKKILGLNK